MVFPLIWTTCMFMLFYIESYFVSIVSLLFDRKILKYHTDNQRNFLGICKYKYKILIGQHFNNILFSLICTFNTLDIHRNSSTIENRGGVHALSFLIHFSIVRENFDKKKKNKILSGSRNASGVVLF